MLSLVGFNLSNYMFGSIFFLDFFSIIRGWVLSWLLFPIPEVLNILQVFKIIPCALVILSFVLFFFLFHIGYTINSFFSFFIGGMWFLPRVTT